MAFKQNLLVDFTLAGNSQKRILPSLNVENFDRLHFHISNGTSSIANVHVRILYGTPVGARVLLADSTVWVEEGSNERDFEFTTPATYNGTGFVLSVPVVAPLLYDVIITNKGSTALNDLHVSVLAQET